MSKYNTVVFDLETCGLSDDAVILSISAVRFNRFDIRVGTLNKNSEDVFDYSLDVREQVLLQRAVESGTMEWWKTQPVAAQEAAFFKKVEHDTPEVLSRFFEFTKGCQIYCRGTDFDPPKLKSLCNDFNVRWPYSYSEFRDVRTYVDACTGGNSGYIECEDPLMDAGLVPHISINDCWRDAVLMVQARNWLLLPTTLNRTHP